MKGGGDTRVKSKVEEEGETSLKSHVNPMGRGSRVHRSINLDRDNAYVNA